jgi:putative ABC transport system permease protein
VKATRYHLRSLLVRWRTTVASAGGIAMVAFMIAATVMLVAALKKGITAVEHEDAAIVIRQSADNEFSSAISTEDAAAAVTKPGVLVADGAPMASTELVVAATFGRDDGSRASIQLRGVPSNVMTVRSHTEIVAGRAPRWSASEVMIGERLRGRFPGFEVGQSFELRKGTIIKVVGIFKAGAAYDSEVWLDRSLAQTAFGREGRASSIYLRLESASAFPRLTTALAEDKRLGLQAFRERAYFEKQAEGRAAFIQAASSLVGGLFGFGAMLGAMITMFAAVESRQREIGTLRALGFSRTTVLFGFLLESSIVALAAGALGTLLATSLAMTSITMLDINSRAEVILDFELTSGVVLAAVLGSLAMGLLGGLLPAWRAAHMSVLDSLRAA